MEPHNSRPSAASRRRGGRPLPLSVMPGIRYPALPATADAVMLALLYQYEQSEWWAPDQLFEHQLRQAAALLDHARRTVPFYKKRLAAAARPRRGRLTPEAWRRIPILSRSRIQDAREQIVSRSIPKDHGAVQWVRTSGSTGEPLEALRSALDRSIYKAMNLRKYLWHRFDLRAKVAAIRLAKAGTAEPPHGSQERGYWAAAHPTGKAVRLSIGATLSEQLSWLELEAPDYLLSYPTNIRALALRCEEQGVRLPSLRSCNSFGEVLDPEVRAICRRVWDVPIIDSYSTIEIGMVALQCPEYEHYHTMDEGVLVEILDEHGKPCPPGGVGRVVLTSLHSFAMPLIRYAIGDFAEVGEPCPCGRGLPVLKRILGRTRDMLILPSGEQRWLNLSGVDVMVIEPVRQWQIVQRGREMMEVTLVVSRPLMREEQERLTGILHRAFNHPFPITFKYVDAIAREPSGKYTVFRCAIEDPGT